ncbi:MAG: type ISP restriction/modification enzyme [Phormidesmis sp.]
MAFINNHSYLDTPTFRGMRSSLLKTFDDIFVLDLHGNNKKKEQSPDGSIDKNVFDIQQGVAIGLFIRDKLRNINKGQVVKKADLWGSRDSKYEWLLNNHVNTTHWEYLNPPSPFYVFAAGSNESIRVEYESLWGINKIFKEGVVGIQSSRDHFVFDFDSQPLLDRIKEFSDSIISDEAIRNKYFKGKGSSKYLDGDTRGWKMVEARRLVRQDEDWSERVISCLYRPFDNRSLYYAEWMLDWSRSDVMAHMIDHENLALITNRSLETRQGWKHVFCSDQVIQNHSVSIKEGNYLFPLFLHHKSRQNNSLKFSESKESNISSGFMAFVEEKLGFRPMPKNLFYYIYSVLHSPEFRSRYTDLLQIDYPRIPVTQNPELFTCLSGYGEKLAEVHLFKSDKLQPKATTFLEGRDLAFIVDPGHPKYANGKVTINKRGAGFTGVPQEVWEFYVGGYQVCHKWLKDRKGRTLSDNDILHYQKIIVALQETIRIMQQIDDAIPSWPIE